MIKLYKAILLCICIGSYILLSIGYKVFGYGQPWKFITLFSSGWIGFILICAFFIGIIGLSAFDMINPKSHYNRAMDSALRYLDDGNSKDYNEFYHHVSHTDTIIHPTDKL